ncbi:MAG: hypothetical protein E3J28_06260 [Desulfobacteraceae bacterium]|nr:MAG: hypothetical protein E3J28_06260 [Desulfobacteraceae bacterium]
MKFEEEWDDLFDIKIGPFGMGAYFGPRPFKVRYSRTSNSHLLRFQINRDVKKEEIKVRLIEPGILEIEWPRKIKGEEIPVE